MAMPTPDAWIEEEFGWCELGDERLEWRLKQIVADLAAQPTASLPQAAQDAAALKATYRFLDNDDIDHQDLLLGHQLASLARLRQHPLVLAVQDTSYLDFSDHPGTQGLGPLAQAQQKGLCTHNTMAFTPQRLPLGLLQQQVWVREEATYAKQEDHKSRPIDQKESQKWLGSLQAVNEIAALCPDTLLLSVGDREADVYDLLIAARAQNVHLLLRACRDRCLQEQGKLKAASRPPPKPRHWG
jgi:hypothetical protein